MSLEDTVIHVPEANGGPELHTQDEISYTGITTHRDAPSEYDKAVDLSLYRPVNAFDLDAQHSLNNVRRHSYTTIERSARIEGHSAASNLDTQNRRSTSHIPDNRNKWVVGGISQNKFYASDLESQDSRPNLGSRTPRNSARLLYLGP